MPRQARPSISTSELDELIEQATVDCYNDSEQVTGLFTMIEEHLALPFTTTLLGVPVTVARVDVTRSDEIVAIYTRDGHRQTIPIRDLPIPDPAPDGWEWIEAYRRWARWM
ncbi:MAG: hypothetical protein ACP5H2_06145 [Solirubrobacteraceae bacterium]